MVLKRAVTQFLDQGRAVTTIMERLPLPSRRVNDKLIDRLLKSQTTLKMTMMSSSPTRIEPSVCG
jgi:hypothetical protein